MTLNPSYRSRRRFGVISPVSLAWVAICTTFASVLFWAAAPTPSRTLASVPSAERVVCKPIEQIKKGDTVLAHDFATGQNVPRKVYEIHRNYTRCWVDINLNDGSSITATRFHLFWVESEQEWFDAVELQPGMTLRFADGQTRAVCSVQIREVERPEATFNIEVEGAHNYFAGPSGILLHNGVDLDTVGFWNYFLQDADGNAYYHGMAGPNQTKADVEYRHSQTHDRFNPENMDELIPEPGTRTYGEARRMEHERIARDGTNIGRDPDTWRGNRQNGISDRNRGRYYPDDC